MLNTMSQANLFYSASDADTEGEEGNYFVYTYDEVVTCLKEQQYDVATIEEITRALSISVEGNFEGKNIIQRTQEERAVWFDDVMTLLKRIRHTRSYPFIDKKIQVSWNAMMISALFTLAEQIPKYLMPAQNHLKALLESMLIDNTLYHATLIHKTPKVEAFLEDYAYLGRTVIQAYESTFEAHYLLIAQQLANTALMNFYEEGRWYFSKGEFVTEADISDSSYPGSVGVMVDLLLSLGTLVDEKYRRFAFKSLEFYSQKLSKTPISFPYLLDQAHRYIREDRIIKAKRTLLLENQKALSHLTYPYTKRYASADNHFMLCGLQSCFAHTQIVSELNLLLSRSL